MDNIKLDNWLESLQAEWDAEDAKLTPDELIKVKIERAAKAAKSEALRIDAVVPTENITTNGHRALMSELKYSGAHEVRVSGQKADPDDPTEDPYTYVSGVNTSCLNCGVFIKNDYDEETNTLVLRGEQYSYEYEAEPDEHGRHRPIAGSEKVVFVSGPCEYDPEMETVVRINIPSGKIIADDSLRQVYNPNYDDGDYNTPVGQALAVTRNAEVGCAYFPVENSCPSVYLRPDGSYVNGSRSL